MPKLLFSCVFAALSVFSFSSVISANIIDNSLGPNGVSSFTLDGATFQFQGTAIMQCAIPSEVAPNCSTGYMADSTSSVESSGDNIAVDDNYHDGPKQPPGTLIGPDNIIYGSEAWLFENEEDPGGKYQAGPWRVNPVVGPTLGYLGIRVEGSDGYHYGWASLDASGALPSPKFPDVQPGGVFLDYAYESCPDQSIAAGATSGGASCADPPTPTPEPSTDVLLAIGLAGLEGFYLAGGRIRLQR